MSDVRKQFILSSVASCLGLNTSDDLLSEFIVQKEVDVFLDDISVFILNVSLIASSSGNSLLAQNCVDPGDGTRRKSVVFFKTTSTSITGDNLHTSIVVFSLIDSPLSVLYHSLRTVYAPTFLTDNTLNPKLQRLLSDLQSGLKNTLLHGEFTSDSSDVILTPADELKFWKEKPEDARSRVVVAQLRSLDKLFSALRTSEFGEMEELIDETTNILDDLWKSEDAKYPEDRMRVLLEVSGGATWIKLQSEISKLHLWQDDFALVDDTLSQALVVIQLWAGWCKKHTGVIWPNYPPHRWTGEPFAQEFVDRVIDRLTVVRRLRAFHKQLTKLLTREEQSELSVSAAFDVFSEVNVLNCNSFTDSVWSDAVKRFHNHLLPCQRRVANKLSFQLKAMADNPTQLLQEFSRYRELIHHDFVRNELVSERKHLAGTLNEHILSVRRDFRRCNGQAPFQLLAVPPVINNIYWAKNLERQISNAAGVIDALLSDLELHVDIEKNVSQLLVEVQELHEAQFETWSRETLELVGDKSLTLSTDSHVVEFDGDKNMRVTYNRKLTGLVREVRQLMVLGYQIPSKIVDATNLAKNYLAQATSLEQIANFHNTIGDRIIDSQKPMLLESANKFALLVKTQKNVTWRNSEAVNAYIVKLQTAIDRLGRDNNRLIVAHKTIERKVLEMMETDLLRKQQKWKELLREVREVFYELESLGFKDQKTWKAHWDRQIYKALEYQYQLGLEMLSEHMTELKVDVVYRNKKLQFSPPIEEIRLKYYNQMKRFLNIPLNFRGVDSSSHNTIFRLVVERNALRFGKLFQEGESLFLSLEKALTRFEQFVVLGSVDITSLLEEHCTTPEDFENNFRCSKSKGQEIGKLPISEEKIGCITLMYGAVISEIETINRRYWDSIVSHLQHTILRQAHTVNAFIVELTEKLARQPQTAEEVGLSAANRNEAVKKLPQMQVVVEHIHKENRLLAHWTKDSIQQVDKVTAKWDQFLALLDNFDVVMTKQINGFKTTLNAQVSQHLAELDRFGSKWNEFSSMRSLACENYDGVVGAIEKLKEKRNEWCHLMEERGKLFDTCQQFDIPESGNDDVSRMQSEIDSMTSMFELFEQYHSGMESMLKEDWIVFRTKIYKFKDYLSTWRTRLVDEESNAIVVRVTKHVDECFDLIPCLQYVRGDAFSDLHWKKSFQILGLSSINVVEKLSFGDLLSAKAAIVQNKQELEQLSMQAAGEISIRQALQELDIWEIEAKLSLFSHVKSDGSCFELVKEWKELLNKVGDFQVLLQSLKDSQHYHNFADHVQIWEKRLVDLNSHLTLLNAIQRKWVYLEPIFSRGALPDEQNRFRRVDERFSAIMSDMRGDTRLLSICKRVELHEALPHMLDQLQRCQKTLKAFLEIKRNRFPRFYFIGDEDLLEILGRSNDVDVIQLHLKKLFSGIFRVGFDDHNKRVVSMISSEDEVVFLTNSVEVTDTIDEWLGVLSQEMKRTLKHLVIRCLKESKNDTLDPTNYPSQVLCLVESIIFTERCEKAVVGNRLQELLQDTKNKLNNYTCQKVDTVDSSGKVLRSKIYALILDTIHHIRIVEELISAGSRSLSGWVWQKKVRYYLRSDSVYVKVVDAEFLYSFEYQGNAVKLVQTPLNEKCFLTLTQALKMGMGGNPYGPAGTGKTESVKYLGSCLGRQVIVFNCDEGLDVKSMGRIFTGIVKSGAWGCFDEFNRLEESVLSALSMQVRTIQEALKNKQEHIKLLDNQVNVDQNSAIFITMNPADKDYGGRSNLPDNLKQLFRPIAMSNPNNELIIETLLYAEGFKHARRLGSQIQTLFKLASELLSNQHHYDWGLRAQKPVIMKSGLLLKAVGDNGSSESSELQCVAQAVRMNTMSKLVHSDVIRFQHLLRDVFPGIQHGVISNDDFMAAVRQAYDDLDLEENCAQIEKVVEIYEQLSQRVGCILVGPSGCGKSSILKLLRFALLKMGQSLKVHTLSPKAMPRTQLLGYIDADTREWFDGVLTAISRQVVDEPVSVRSWIVFDGDIDPEWIESLNSVLDGNMILTLPSGERIQFGNNTNFIFETDDLTYASPATITRMGVVYLSSENHLVKSVVNNWLNKFDDSIRQDLQPLVDSYLYRALEFTVEMNAPEVMVSLITTVRSCLSHLYTARSTLGFCVALIKGLMSNLKKWAQIKLAMEIMSWVGETLPDKSNPLNFRYNSRHNCLERMGEINNEITSEYSRGGELPFVPTNCVNEHMGCLKVWLHNSDEPILIVGPDGCGKSKVVLEFFNRLKYISLVNVHCNTNSSYKHILTKLSQACIQVNSSTGKNFKPRGHDKLVLFIRNVNLPSVDKYGTSAFMSFLRGLIAYKGFWDNSLEWVSLQNIQVVCSMVNSRTPVKCRIARRFSSLFRILVVDYPSIDELRDIYSLTMRSVFQVLPEDFKKSWVSRVDKLCVLTLTLLEKLQSTFTTVEHPHYTFTLKNLSELVWGLTRYDFSDSTSRAPIAAWCHESRRLFRDKLVSQTDRDEFDRLLSDIVASEFSVEIEPLNRSYFVVDSSQSESESLTFMNNALLSEISSEEWARSAESASVQYVAEHRDIEHRSFKEVLDTLAHLNWSLSRPAGSVVMAGRSGSGRRTAAGVIGCMLKMTAVSLKIGRTYSLKDFRADVKSCMHSAGMENRQTLLIIEGHQLIEHTFLEVINSLLSSGEVPGIFSTEEIEAISNNLKNEHSRDSHIGSVFDYFCYRVHMNLHIVLIMDFTDPSFVTRCWSNPALLKQCSLLWMDHWSEVTLRKLPVEMISDIQNEKSQFQKDSAEMKKLTEYFQAIHSAMPNESQTPRRYTDFIKTFCTIYVKRRDAIFERQEHLHRGVSKINEASMVVAKMKKRASEHDEKLSLKQNEVEDALNMIKNTMQSASQQKEDMETLRARTRKENAVLHEKKQDIDRELAEIGPLIAEAKKAVGSIKPESLAEVRVLRVPPDVIRDILEGVMGLLGINDASWNNMKIFLGRRTVKDDILNFDARSVSPAQRKHVSKLIKDRSNSFEVENAKRASKAAEPLAAWVRANLKYSTILEKIKPLEDERNSLQKNLNDAQLSMKKLGDDLSDVDKHVQRLSDQLNASTRDAAVIEIELKKARESLAASESLVNQLAEEHLRWSNQLQRYDDELNKLPLLSLLSAAFVVYLSDATVDQRNEYASQWCRLVGLDSFDLSKHLSSEKEILNWRSEGLPADDISIENGVIVKECRRCVLLVDPSSSAIAWLKSHLRNVCSKCDVVSQQSDRFYSYVESAVRFGHTVIVEEFTRFEPLLLPLIRRDVSTRGTRQTIQLGGKVVDYDPNFNIFLTTRSNNLVINPEYRSCLTVVNFVTTRSGLCGRLLTLSLQLDKPELAIKREQLVKQEEENKIKLFKLEDDLLSILSNSKGNILENEDLLKSLRDAKSSWSSIERSIEDIKSIQSSLEDIRLTYFPLADYGSRLYFAISDISLINVMYQYSLASFVALFKEALQVEKNSTDTKECISDLKNILFNKVYSYVSRSLLKNDQLTFTLHLLQKLESEKLGEDEWEVFIGKKSTTKGEIDVLRKSLPSWIPDDWVMPMSTIRTLLPALWKNMVIDDESVWVGFMSRGDCETYFPAQVQEHLTPFQRLLIIHLLRPDRSQNAMNTFVKRTFSRKLVPPDFNLSQVQREGNSRTPIMIMFLPGTDPSEELRQTAIKIVGKQRFHEVPMGRDQSSVALDMLKKCCKSGDWLCLKNIHLDVSWIPMLESEFSRLEPHENFRLWLTTQPHPGMPSTVLMSSLKLTYETPPGIKKNMLRTYSSWGPDFVNGSSSLSIHRSQILCSLAWCHALVEERRSYIPGGWINYYEFGDDDLKSGCDVVERWVSSGELRWDLIHGLMESVVYGNRIDNATDFQVLCTYIIEAFNSKVAPGSRAGQQELTRGIVVPASSDFKDYIRLVHQLSDVDLPEYFGLPQNIDHNVQRLVGSHVTSQLLLISRSLSNSYHFDREKWEKDLSPVLNLWKKLNSGVNLTKQRPADRHVSASFSDSGTGGENPSVHADSIDPVDDFLQLEYNNGLHLVQHIHSGLASISKVLRGVDRPSSDVFLLTGSLLRNHTPQSWMDIWIGPDTPLLYLRAVVQRTLACDRWIKRATAGTLLVADSAPLDLSELFRPHVFLNAVRQKTCRRLGVPIDRLKLITICRASTDRSWQVPVRVSEVLMEGCCFDGVQLKPVGANSLNASAMPVFTLVWMESDASRSSSPASDDCLSVPLYQNSKRRQLITNVDLPCPQSNKAVWIKAGIALFLKD